MQLAEELGFDGVWGFDQVQPMYGDGPGETFEGMATLAALAGVTESIRLGLLVTGVTFALDGHVELEAHIHRNVAGDPHLPAVESTSRASGTAR